MTTPIRFEQDLGSLLEDLYVPRTPDYRDDLVEQVRRTRQRPAWTFPGRWFPMEIATQRIPVAGIPWRTAGILALVAILLGALVSMYVGSRTRLPAPFGPAANGQLVYPEGGDILVRDSVDSAARVLVGGPAVDLWAGFSPLGDRLAIVREADAGEELWVSRADGSDLRRIGGPYEGSSWIEWSPDQSSIAVAHDRRGLPTVTIAATDGSGERRLVNFPAMDPAWRPPGGAQLVFRGKELSHWGLYLVDVASGAAPERLDLQQQSIEFAEYDLLHPAWSPNGDRLAFHTLVRLPSSQIRTPGFRVHVAEIGPRGEIIAERHLEANAFHDDELNPAFTPDGRHIVFQVRLGWTPPDPESGTPTVDRLFIVPADGSGPAQDLGVVSTNGDGITYTVAPDGTSLIAHLWAEGETWIIDPATKTAREADFAPDEAVSWQRRAP